MVNMALGYGHGAQDVSDEDFVIITPDLLGDADPATEPPKLINTKPLPAYVEMAFPPTYRLPPQPKTTSFW